METPNVQIVYIRATPEYVKRAVAKYNANHREENKAYFKSYVARMKEDDIDKWRAKKREYQQRYYEKQRLKKLQAKQLLENANNII